MPKCFTSPIVLVVLLACMSIGASAALSESTIGLLKKYDDFALYNIWRTMTYTAFY